MRYFFQHLIEAFHLPLKNPVLVFSILLFIILLSPILLRKLKIPLHYFSSVSTYDRLEKVAQANKVEAELYLHELENIETFYPLYQKKNSDLVCMIACRLSSVSFDTQSEQILNNIPIAFERQDYLIVYPGIVGSDSAIYNYDDINSAPFVAGVETIQKISRKVGNIFKKGKE